MAPRAENDRPVGSYERAPIGQLWAGPGERMRPGLTVVRSESPLGRWIRHAWTPPAGDPLHGVVREVVHWAGEAAISRERLFPGPTVELVVHVGAPHRIVRGGRSSALPSACVSGVSTGPVTLEAPPGESTVLCIRLHPAGARSVLGRPLDELVDRTVDLRDCIGPSSRTLVDALEGRTAAEERLDRAIAWIVARWRGGGVADPAVAWVASEIERTAGTVPVTRLRERTGLSRSGFPSRSGARSGSRPSDTPVSCGFGGPWRSSTAVGRIRSRGSPSSPATTTSRT